MGKASRKKEEQRTLHRETPTSGGSPERSFLRTCFEKRIVHLLLIAVIGLLAYSNTFHVPFLFDDIYQIEQNVLIRDIGNLLGGVEDASLKGDYNPRRHIGYITLALNYRFGKLNVTGYHAVNLAIHIANAILVYFLVILTFRTPCFLLRNAECGLRNQNLKLSSGDSRFTFHDPQFVALFSALLFVSHPVQTQAVTYVVQRFTSLATMFYLLSIVMYIKGRQWAMGNGQEASSAPSSSSVPIAHRLLPIACFCLSLLSAVLAMKTKEIAFTLPIMIILYEFVFFGSTMKKRLLFLLPVALTLIVIPISILGTEKPLGEILSDLSDKTRLQTDISRWDYLATQMRVMTTYVRLLFLPVDQNLDYDYPIYHFFLTPSVFVSLLFLLSLFGTAVFLLYKSQRAKRIEQSVNDKEQRTDQNKDDPIPYALCPVPYASYRLIAFGIMWFFVALSVESSVIPIVDVIFEHRVYLPAVGFFIAVVTALSLIPSPSQKKILSVFLCVIIMGLGGVTYARNSVWKNDITLWQDVVRKSPNKARPHYNLGVAYDEHRNIPKAMEEYTKAVELSPRFAEAHNNLGAAYASVKRYDKAIEAYRKALAVNPGMADVYNNLGIAYLSMNNLKDSMDSFLSALRIAPDYAEAHFGLGQVYMKMGENQKAEETFRKALHLKPDISETYYFTLALTHINEGRYREALEAGKEALRLNPRSPDNYNNLSTIYRKLGMYREAIDAAEKALEIRPDYAIPYNNLGLAYVELRKYGEALEAFKKAVSLDPGYAEGFNDLGGIYIVLARYDEAVEALREALRIDPDYVSPRANLGIAYSLKGDREAAMREYAILKDVSPRDAEKIRAAMGR